MRLRSVLKSNHDLKKNGYQILRKLHKMEKRNGAERAYAKAYDNTFFFVLYVQSLVEIIKREYPEAAVFSQRCEGFLRYLDEISKEKCRIDKSVLASFLHAYTSFFNRIIEEKHKFYFTQDIVELWNVKCLMAYIAVWGGTSEIKHS